MSDVNTVRQRPIQLLKRDLKFLLISLSSHKVVLHSRNPDKLDKNFNPKGQTRKNNAHMFDDW